MIAIIKRAALLLACACGHAASGSAAEPPSLAAGSLGPYNVTILQGGVGMSRSLPGDLPILAAGAAWSMTAWIKVDVDEPGEVVLAALGRSDSDNGIRLMLDAGRLALRVPGGQQLLTHAKIPIAAWTAVAATADGKIVRLYIDGREAAMQAVASSRAQPAPRLASELHLGPSLGEPAEIRHFGGSLASFQLSQRVLAPDEVSALAAAKPNFDLIVLTQVGVGWPPQHKAWIGLQVPQDPWTLPQGRAAAKAPVAAPLPPNVPLSAKPDGVWRVGGWRLAAESAIAAGAADGARLSAPGVDDTAWYAATVPGTVLTTLIDRGVYADPDYGLNNLLIPESLARQDYWYRTGFMAPARIAHRQLTLTFKGINYAAEVWLNGALLGRIRGAFTRGVFDVTHHMNAGGINVLAVRISPPPHPGIPSEESIAYGPGENGGSMTVDGPTFMATEGWDWIPAIRDRDSGLWQDVELKATGLVRMLDAAVITHLPLPRIDVAELRIRIPMENDSASVRSVSLEAAVDGITLRKQLDLAPGRSEVNLDAREFPQLKISRPALWWPNGYGPATLHSMRLTLADADGVSESQVLRFGMRELSYELSLFDSHGRLRRVEVDPGAAPGVSLVDTRHEAIKQVPNGWAQSLTAAGENSPAVRNIATESLAPFLVIRVNGVPIAARGGSWGMDDSRKRISRERLEPYFRLHREAHLNIIRNWLGQNTEEVFYELADEYGLLVLNDFWESTQDFQLEAQDPALFLQNARDVISRYRNHPSIAVWFGRNEGVPQPIINEGLAELVRTLDGTRLYTGSSNRVNLQDSGPYNYRAPAGYFTDLGLGFAVELGMPSLATLESIRAMVPAADRWPLSDTIAYHDWHFGGNGDVATFMQALAAQFGSATSLEDFERKAQMMNYVDYRAIFEGFAAQLWRRNSGRLLWMTHPAWPSNHWQIYSSDYDTQASYYGVKKATEPLHVQMNLPDYAIAVVNTTQEPRARLKVTSRILSLDNRELAVRTDAVAAAANQVTTLMPVDLERHFQHEDVVLVQLRLSDASGTVLSENSYWQSRDEASMQRLNSLRPQTLRVSAVGANGGAGANGAAGASGEAVVGVTLRDTGTQPILAAKLTLLDDHGERILPAFYSDNYLTLLPGEPRRIEIRFPRSRAAGARIGVRGWNVEPGTSTIAFAAGGTAK